MFGYGDIIFIGFLWFIVVLEVFCGSFFFVLFVVVFVKCMIC